jgi:hypothetical protein
MKRCSVCKKKKPITSFYTRTGSQDGLRHDCKKCVKSRSTHWHKNNRVKSLRNSASWRTNNPEKAKSLYAQWRKNNRARRRTNNERWAQANPDKIKQSQKRWYEANPDKVKNAALKRYYGITLKERDDLLRAQNGLCLVCAKPITHYPCVDHNHATGQVRGILHSKCNTAIGLFNDDPATLERAITYLKTH